MENRKDRKYVIILIASSVLFIVGMIVCIFNLKFTYTPGSVRKMSSGNSQSVGERMDYLESQIAKHGPDVIYDELFYGHSYETEFDEYWDFADIQVAGIRGRFAEDNTKYRKIIEDYIATCDDDARKSVAESYLELFE